jgi:glycosyltransferase involved in cell wall biosynthesis
VVLEKKHGLVYDLVFTGSEKGNGMWVKQVAASLGLSSRVHIAGFVEREALHFYYTHARAMVYASLCGPENLPPLEAAQLNCPVVAANVPGAEEQLGDFAQLVDGLSADAWADAIAKLETDAEFREKSIAAGLKRSKSFSGADFVKRFVSLAQETLPLRRTWGW